MNTFFTKHAIALAAVTFAFVIVPLAIFGMRYFSTQIDEDLEVLQTKQIDQAVQQDFLLNSETLALQKKTVEADRSEIDVLLEETDDSIITLYAEIENLSRQSQNSFVELKVDQYKSAVTTAKKVKSDPVIGNTEESDIPAVVPKKSSVFAIEPMSDKFLYLHITTIGTYNNYLEFVKRLENMQYFADILSMTVVVHETGNRTRNGVDGEPYDARPNLVAGELYIGFYLSGGAALDDKVENPAAGLDSVNFIK